MTYFDPSHAAEAADEDRTHAIAAYLDRNDTAPRDAFFTVMDDAPCAEEDAKLRGLYPPIGHGYPRESRP
ncbi:hypothetical protein [Streptomyces xiamenensis]|uniref:hypothetical protein n=1 Tax=Streptomyces xiamenensis TaxID=408015 RepID=UPI003D747951